MSKDLNKTPFTRKGIRLHAPKGVGRAPGQILEDATKAAIANDPVMGGAMVQNRIGRYADFNPADLT